MIVSRIATTAILAASMACAPPDSKSVQDSVRDTIAAAPRAEWSVRPLPHALARFRPTGWSSEDVLWGLVRGRITRFDTRTGQTRTFSSTGWAGQNALGVAVWHNEQGLWLQREGDTLRRIVGPSGEDTTRRGDGPHVLLAPDGRRALLGWQQEWDTDYDLLEADGSRRRLLTRIPGYYLNSAALWLDSTRVLFHTVAMGPQGGEPTYRESGWRDDLAVLDLRTGKYEHVTRVRDETHLRVAGWYGNDVLVTEWLSGRVQAHWLYDTTTWERRATDLPKGRAFPSRAGAVVVLLDTQADTTQAVLIAADTTPLGTVARDAEPYFTPSGVRGAIHTTRGVMLMEREK